MTPEQEEELQLEWKRREEAEWERRMEEERLSQAICDEERRQEEENNSQFGVGS